MLITKSVTLYMWRKYQTPVYGYCVDVKNTVTTESIDEAFEYRMKKEVANPENADDAAIHDIEKYEKMTNN